ncbi:WD domain, G-beta repeat [Musa troglodytarum]|uniref:WD domain, G-beta repeat n=2 Tax=Musa troglodytarum TaxID=320322 RepID=A0A9E7HYB6_9LILI|nr:WD domain, G-beta repeat [Musa troglodytarum]
MLSTFDERDPFAKPNGITDKSLPVLDSYWLQITKFEGQWPEYLGYNCSYHLDKSKIVDGECNGDDTTDLMASPLMRLRDREWYSPASNELAYPGDRFIPTRSLMNLDFARSSLTERRRRAPAAIDSPVILTPKDEYRRRVEENMRLDSEGKPRKMLVFRGSPRNSKPSVLLVDEMMKDQQERLRPTDRIRHVPKSADRILDGTALLDDYYLNLMDWGKKNILAVALGRSVYLWNATNNSVQLLLTADEDDHPTSVAWSVDAKTVAVGFAGSRVEIWDAVELQQVRILEGHSGRVGSLSWNQNVLTSGSHDASIINHDVRSSHHLASRLKAHSEEVCGLKWSGGGNLLASGGNDNLVHVWESSKMGSSRYLHRYTDHCAAVRALAWCPFRSSTLASGGGTADQCIKIWNTQTGECLCAGVEQTREGDSERPWLRSESAELMGLPVDDKDRRFNRAYCQSLTPFSEPGWMHGGVSCSGRNNSFLESVRTPTSTWLCQAG